MSNLNYEKSLKVGGIAAITTSSLGFFWVLNVGGLAYLYGLIIECFHVLLGFAVTSFVVAFFVAKGSNWVGLLTGLGFGVMACLYLYFTVLG